jgi:hypothetical protein
MERRPPSVRSPDSVPSAATSAPEQKRGRLTGDHDRAHRLVGFERVEGVDDLGDHRAPSSRCAVLDRRA